MNSLFCFCDRSLQIGRYTRNSIISDYCLFGSKLQLLIRATGVMQVLWCIPERVHSPQFKASPVVSKGFFWDGGDAVGVGTRFLIRFLLREAGTSADIFYNNPEARPRPFVLLPLLMQR